MGRKRRREAPPICTSDIHIHHFSITMTARRVSWRICFVGASTAVHCLSNIFSFHIYSCCFHIKVLFIYFILPFLLITPSFLFFSLSLFSFSPLVLYCIFKWSNLIPEAKGSGCVEREVIKRAFLACPTTTNTFSTYERP